MSRIDKILDSILSAISASAGAVVIFSSGGILSAIIGSITAFIFILYTKLK